MWALLGPLVIGARHQTILVVHSVGELLTGIDFALKRSRQYTKQLEPTTLEQQAVEIISPWLLGDYSTPEMISYHAPFPQGLDHPVEDLNAFYESSLGYVMAQAGVPPDTAPCEYCAPEIDPA